MSYEEMREKSLEMLEQFVDGKQRRKLFAVVEGIAKYSYNLGYSDGQADAEKDSISKIWERGLEVGDEVVDLNGITGVIVNTDTHWHVLYPHNGKTWKAPKDRNLFRPTGRKLDLLVKDITNREDEPYTLHDWEDAESIF